jgi:hypothetical protein
MGAHKSASLTVGLKIAPLLVIFLSAKDFAPWRKL